MQYGIRLGLTALVAWGCVISTPAQSLEKLLSTNSTWRFVRGTNEASVPTNAWRAVAFDDSAWEVGSAPFHFGTNSVGGYGPLTNGTILSDMRSNYTTMFLRQTFVADTNEILGLQFGAYMDDGMSVYVNGTLYTNYGVVATRLAYNDTATANRLLNFYFTGPMPLSLLKQGTNLLTLQAFNFRATNDDFRIDAEVIATVQNYDPPRVASVDPPPGSMVTNLSQITVQFSEPVVGIVADDFMINGNPCLLVTGSNATYTYFFTPPLAGAAQVRWDINHTIADGSGMRFDETQESSLWEYTVVDGAGPIVIGVSPTPGAVLSGLTEIEVAFNEAVAGLDAADLRVNGQPAISVVPTERGSYRFQFTPPTPGVLAITWAPGHNITDLAPAPNAFVGQSWYYTNDPATAFAAVVINELSAENLTKLQDEDLQEEDWIELLNRGTNAVRLLGWSLSDDPTQPGLWEFPDIVLNPGEYRVVFASGKNRKPTAPGGKLHTNFRLNPFGEYLGLYNAQWPRQAVSELVPQFPQQRPDISYGRSPGGEWVYYETNTPGAPNPAAPLYVGMASPPVASVKSGFFNQPFNLVLSTPTPGAAIYYTLDGSPPGLTNTLYTGPIAVAGSSNKAVVLVRAAAFKASWLSSEVTTHTYIFPDYVVYQPNNPAGFPTLWDSPGSKKDIPADYEMDPQIVTNRNNLAVIRDGLARVPSLSIVSHTDLLFGPAKGVYVRREDWNQQPVNVEMIFPDGTSGFSVPAGLEIQGGTSPDDAGSSWKSKKLSLRLIFKGDFGAKNLDYQVFPDSPVSKFNTLVLDNGLNHVWHYNGTSSPEQQRQTAQYVRDQYLSDLQIAAGSASAHWRFVHVFLNGLYWGITGLHERPDDKWSAEYFGGDDSEYDVLRHNNNNVVAGGNTVYNQMFTFARQGLANNANYERLQQQYLDLPWFIDYMIINYWAGNEDWAHQNWYATRRRLPNAGWRYVSWDAEHVLENVSRNSLTLTNASGPTELFHLLLANPEFRLRFGDHVHRHFFNQGILAVSSSAPVNLDNPSGNQPATLYLKRIQEVEPLLVGESARWGDSGNNSTDRSNNPLTKEGDWVSQLRTLMGLTNAGGYHASMYNYFPNRTATVLNQFKALGAYPSLAAPAFSQHGGRIPAGYSLHLTNVAGAGTLYYTTNELDPRVYGSGAVHSLARPYSAGVPLVLAQTTWVKARTLNGTNWSALNEALFTVGELGLPLRITEIMYAPLGGGAYEYLELQNAGAFAIDLSNFRLDGIGYTFPQGSVLPGGAYLVLASGANTNLFRQRYPNLVVSGFFSGALNNAGERIAVLDQEMQTVVSVTYRPGEGWPEAAAWAGNALELVNPQGNPNDPANWRASVNGLGSPGLPNTVWPASAVVLNEVMADNVAAVTNGGTCPDWIELYNSGAASVSLQGWSLTDDGNPRKYVFPDVVLGAGQYLVVWCDDQTNAPGLHTRFALSRAGESLFLFDANNNQIDSLAYGVQVSDYTVGRMDGNWRLTVPTPGTTNQPAILASATNLVINEWLADAAPGGSDWFELFNRATAAPVALQGTFLSINNTIYPIQSLSFVPAGGFLQLFADEQPGGDHVDFKLPKDGGVLVFYDKTALEVSRVTFGMQLENVSQGRLPDGGPAIVSFVGSPSPAASNYLIVYTGPFVNEIMARNQSLVVGPSGAYADWVEIRNPNATAFDLSGMSLSDSPSRGRWAFPSGSTVAGNGYLLVWCDNSAPASTVVSTNMNTGFALDGASGGVYLFNALGQLVQSVDYGFQAENLSIGLAGGPWTLLSTPTPGAANAAAAALGSVSNLRINEWMADPLNGSDWFELYNPEPLPVSLTGLYLTDDPSISGVTQFQVGPLSYIARRGWAVWQADNDLSLGRDHVNFALSASGGTIRLYSTLTNQIDAVDYGLQSTNVSQGRLLDGQSNIVSFATTPTPGEANYLPLAGIVINEVLAHTDDPLEDAIELANLSANNVNVGGWYLSHTQDDFKQFRIPAGTNLPPGGFAVFYEYQFNPNPGVPPSFTLNSASDDAVYLSQSDANGNLTGYRAEARFGASQNGVSFGRYPTSVGVDFVAMSSRTLGQDNPQNLVEFRSGRGQSNAHPRIGPVVINEIMYHPVDASAMNVTEDADSEYIELVNVTTNTVPLYDPNHSTNRFRLSGGVEFVFPAHTNLGAGEHLLVVRFDPVADPGAVANFRAKYHVSASVSILGPWSGKLDNAGEMVELYKPDNPQTGAQDAGYVPYILVDRVVYGDTAPWPMAADGGGASLQRLVTTEYGNDPVNWKAAAPTAGRTNTADLVEAPIVSVPPQDQVVIAGSTVVFDVVVSGTEPLSYQWQLNSVDLTDETNAILTLLNVSSSQQGSYRVRVSNSAGSFTSLPATLTVLVPPTVLEIAPQQQTVVAGDSAVFAVSASGTEPIHYQWLLNGVELVNRNESTLTLHNTHVGDAGSYRVIVTNVAGAATSIVATLTVLVPPTITSLPQSQTITEQGNATFSVSVTGDPPLTYQWLVNDVPWPLATNAFFTLYSVGADRDNSRIKVVVTNPAGSVQSGEAILTVLARPVLVDVARTDENQLQFSINGQTGRSYLLEFSTNFVDWITVTNHTFSSGQTVVVDAVANGRQQFIRARLVQ